MACGLCKSLSSDGSWPRMEDVCKGFWTWNEGIFRFRTQNEASEEGSNRISESWILAKDSRWTPASLAKDCSSVTKHQREVLIARQNPPRRIHVAEWKSSAKRSFFCKGLQRHIETVFINNHCTFDFYFLLPKCSISLQIASHQSTMLSIILCYFLCPILKKNI